MRSLQSLPPRALGIAMAASGMLIVSTDSLITRAADVDGFTVTFWFGVFIAPTMFVAVWMLGTPPKAMPALLDGPMVGSTIFQAGSTTFFIFAVKNTVIANAVVIIAAAPIVAALLAWMIIRERTAPRVWAGIALSISGIVVVMSGSFGGGSINGDLLAVAAITCWSVNLIIWRANPELDRYFAVGLGGVLMAMISVLPADIGGHDGEVYLLLFVMGAIAGPAGRVALASATRYLPAAEVSLFAPIETLAAIIWAWLAFDEVPPGRTYVGGAIVLVAFAVATIPMRSRRLVLAPDQMSN